MLYEISRISIRTNKHDETSLSWHNSILTVRTDKGLQLLEFSRNLHCLDKKLDFFASFIPTSKSSPAMALSLNKFAKNNVSNINLTQMIIDPGFWPYNSQLVQEMTNITDFKWSPIGVIHNNESLLAVLNNIGNVELFGLQSNRWTNLYDISETIKNELLPLKDIKLIPNSFEEMKKKIDSLESSAICWGHKLQDDSCYFVTAQRNGIIIILRLHCQDSNVNADIKSMIPTEIGEIVSLQWIPKSEKSILICSNAFGQIFAYELMILKDTIEMVRSTCLWNHRDKMAALYLFYTEAQDKTILLCNKYRHLLAVMIDENLNTVSQAIKNMNDYRITEITYSNNSFFVSTVNCKIYNVKLKAVDNELDFECTLLETKDQFSNHELYGLSFSSNNLICALGVVNRIVVGKKKQQSLEVVLLCSDLQHSNETSLLLDNPTKQLTHFWDCIELIRYKTMKLKALPQADYTQLYEDGNKEAYKMKVYLIYLILFKNLEKLLRNTKGLLPETSIQDIKEKILVIQASTNLNELYAIYQSNEKKLNSFQLESIIGAKKYIEYYCQKKEVAIENFAPQVFETIEFDVQYTCQWCEQKLDRISCTNGHLNLFCIKTFTPIETDEYLVCKSCNSTARIELCRNNPLCSFCDLYLNTCTVPM